MAQATGNWHADAYTKSNCDCDGDPIVYTDANRDCDDYSIVDAHPNCDRIVDGNTKTNANTAVYCDATSTPDTTAAAVDTDARIQEHHLPFTLAKAIFRVTDSRISHSTRRRGLLQQARSPSIAERKYRLLEL